MDNGDIEEVLTERYYVQVIWSASVFLPDATIRVTSLLVTPKYRTKSAPEYPSSPTVIKDISPLASATAHL